MIQRYKTLQIFFSLIIAMVVYGCGIREHKIEMESLERVEYKLSSPKVNLNDELIEGTNKFIFAVTSEERAKYVPKTIWRQAEKKVDEEKCSLMLVAASDSMKEKDIVRFLSGESTKTLQMKGNDWFLLALHGPYWVSEIGVLATGSLTAIVTNRSMAENYEEMAFSMPHIKVFDAPLLCKYLLVKASDETGLELRYLHIKGKQVFANQITRTMGENPVVFDGKDPRNPLSVWRVPVSSNYYKLADSLLEGSGALSNHQKMMVFMDYISEFQFGLGKNDDLTGINEYIGRCGSFANMMAALAFVEGFQTRLITLGNYPENDGHAVCEVFYDDQWHLYDPTYGSYYTTSSAEETVHPYVLSLAELAEGQGDNQDVVCVVTTPQRLNRRNSYGFLGPRIYEDANPKGVIGPTHPLIYPLTMKFSSDKSSSLTEMDFSAKYQGIQYIGAAGVNNMQEWTLNGLEEGEKYDFVVTADSYNGDSPGTFLAKAVSTDASIMSGAEHEFANEKPASMQWRITFVPSSDTAKILLTHDYRGPEFCFVRCSSFELRRTD